MNKPISDTVRQAPAPSPETSERPSGTGDRGSIRPARQWFVGFPDMLTGLAFFGIFVAYAIWLGAGFLDINARVLDIHQVAPILILALALVFPLISGQFDLSGASMATLTTYLTVGLATQQGWPFSVVVVTCLVAGMLGGLLNGVLVVVFKVNAFIATLGTSGIFLGLSSVYSGGTAVTPTAEHPLPDWFSGSDSFGSFQATVPAVIVWVALAALAYGSFRTLRRKLSRTRLARRSASLAALATVVGFVAGGAILQVLSWVGSVSLVIGLVVLVALVLWLVLAFTTFGRYVRASGANPVAARLSGVQVGRQIVFSFVIAGLLAGLAGIVLAAQLGGANPGIAVPYLLPAFAAVFVSTVLFSKGGHFTVWGTLVAGIAVQWVAQGLVVGGLPFTWVPVVNGAVLILAVAASTTRRSA